ncbi:Sap-like sulfolipid-1-addressing protein [Rhodococcus sp. OK519]|uniref:GAP family protein n=1 Tax=Rhodococcus sp. OK519 TaxID=2135729 RepID=UPI000D3AFB5B|nr:Sap-like sulfolipid-1-addressing protein [Rhodococcus sp. OK519]
MGNAVTHLVPVGIEMIVSPTPFAALIAILLSARAKANAAIFTATGITATAVLIGITAFTTEASAEHIGRSAHRTQLVFALTVGLVFVVLAALSWRSRPPKGVVAAMPSWMARIDTMRGGQAAVLGVAIAVVNAKNLPLELKAGALIAEANMAPAQVVLLTVGVALLGGVGLIALSILAAVPSKRVAAALGVVKNELIQHNAAIMTVVFALLAGVQVAHVVTALVVLA